MAHRAEHRWYRDTISLASHGYDPFEHVNNTIYWHGVHEILCQIPTLTAPYRAVLEYRSPIKSGEPLTIRYEQHDDVVRMHFVVGDDVRAAALLRRL